MHDVIPILSKSTKEVKRMSELLLNIEILAKTFYQIIAIDTIISSSDSTLIPFRHSHEKWLKDFEEFKTTFYSQFAKSLYDYLVFARAVEMRHMSQRANLHFFDYYTESKTSRYILKHCTIYSDKEIIRAALIAFSDLVDWEMQYGGWKWHLIAKAATYFHKLPNMVFIDHILDLSHNCSSVFDKGHNIFVLMDRNSYTTFLTNKRYGNIGLVLDYLLYSTQLKKLVDRAKTLGIFDWHYQISVSPTIENVLTYEPIKWGTASINTTLCN